MGEFKGTKGKLKLIFVRDICIGIGTEGDFTQVTANSILPETDEDYENEKVEIESNMLLYSKAPEMLEELRKSTHQLEVCYLNLIKRDLKDETFVSILKEQIEKNKQLIKEATEL